MTSTTGACPKCDGSGRRPVPTDYERRYLSYTAGWDEATDTLNCNNCGGQTMSGKGTGQVTLRADGTPCLHEYEAFNAGRCYTKYQCQHCTHNYSIDSGD